MAGEITRHVTSRQYDECGFRTRKTPCFGFQTSKKTLISHPSPIHLLVFISKCSNFSKVASASRARSPRYLPNHKPSMYFGSILPPKPHSTTSTTSPIFPQNYVSRYGVWQYLLDSSDSLSTQKTRPRPRRRGSFTSRLQGPSP